MDALCVFSPWYVLSLLPFLGDEGNIDKKSTFTRLLSLSFLCGRDEAMKYKCTFQKINVASDLYILRKRLSACADYQLQ